MKPRIDLVPTASPGREITVAELRERTDAVLELLAEGVEPLVVTREGAPVAVLLDPRGFEQIQADRQVLRRVALGEIEAAAGNGEDADDVLDDAWGLLEEN